jgi:predicted nucleic acid-binding protein
VTPPLVLDAAGLDALCDGVPSAPMRAMLVVAHRRSAEVVVPTIVCAELCRGAARTRAVETVLARHDQVGGERPAIARWDTDFALARQVGAILHATGSDTADIVDAHVVAVCVPAGGGVVVTSDPDDIERLAQAVPTVRITTRRP